MNHLDEHDLARYLDGRLTGTARTGIETHLAECRDCRSELAAVHQILGRGPTRSRRVVAWLPLAAAAVLALVWVGRPEGPPRLRDAAVTITGAPQPLTPIGGVPRAREFTWASVPGAGRYRVTLFSPEGDALWQAPTSATTIMLPDSVGLRPGVTYYWQVRAEAAFGRWVSSELVDFVLVTGTSR